MTESILVRVGGEEKLLSADDIIMVTPGGLKGEREKELFVKLKNGDSGFCQLTFEELAQRGLAYFPLDLIAFGNAVAFGIAKVDPELIRPEVANRKLLQTMLTWSDGDETKLKALMTPYEQVKKSLPMRDNQIRDVPLGVKTLK